MLGKGIGRDEDIGSEKMERKRKTQGISGGVFALANGPSLLVGWQEMWQ
jgi:hypothetical protein